MSPSETRAPIGIFGGTFDPVHCAHQRLAEEAIERLGLRMVLWIPAGRPPLRDTPHASAAQRLAMVERATAGNPAFAVDATEVEADQPSYSVVTLSRLRVEHGTMQPLVLLLGADAFARLEGWREWTHLFDLGHIAVATRPGHDLSEVGAGETALAHELRRRRGTPDVLRTEPAGSIVPFAITPMDISGTGLRRQIASGVSVRGLVREPVLDYIEQNNLYK